MGEPADDFRAAQPYLRRVNELEPLEARTMTKLQFHSIAAAVAAAALATAGGSSAAQPATTSLSLMSVQTSFVPVPPISKKSPPQIGGRMFFQDVLYNHAPQFGKPAGARIGTAEIVCTLVSSSHLECVVTAHLPGGELVLTGSNPIRSHHSTFAVTGGSGIYANVSGATTGTDLSSTKTLVTGTLNL